MLPRRGQWGSHTGGMCPWSCEKLWTLVPSGVRVVSGITDGLGMLSTEECPGAELPGGLGSFPSHHCRCSSISISCFTWARRPLKQGEGWGGSEWDGQCGDVLLEKQPFSIGKGSL